MHRRDTQVDRLEPFARESVTTALLHMSNIFDHKLPKFHWDQNAFLSIKVQKNVGMVEQKYD
jgi:hypothetical protein